VFSRQRRHAATPTPFPPPRGFQDSPSPVLLLFSVTRQLLVFWSIFLLPVPFCPFPPVFPSPHAVETAWLDFGSSRLACCDHFLCSPIFFPFWLLPGSVPHTGFGAEEVFAFIEPLQFPPFLTRPRAPGPEGGNRGGSVFLWQAFPFIDVLVVESVPPVRTGPYCLQIHTFFRRKPFSHRPPGGGSPPPGLSG